MEARAGSEAAPPPGVVELREDVPLKAGGGAGGGARCCAAGPRAITASFAVLTAGITLALLTQIYYGDYELVPHGSVSSSEAACSRAGTDALKAGGRALDAAAAAALCLAVVAPHRTSLDAGGSLLYWEYRQSRTVSPALAEWGGPEPQPGAGPQPEAGERPPRLVAALAALHARLGALPWARLLQPAIDLARGGFLVSEGLSQAEGGAPPAAGESRAAPALADYLEALQHNTSAELSSAWGAWSGRVSGVAGGGGAGVAGGGGAGVTPRSLLVGDKRAWAGGGAAGVALDALGAALAEPAGDADLAADRAVQALGAAAGGAWPARGVASGLAVVDSRDTYVALVTGLSVPFGSGPAAGGWTFDSPSAPLDLAPAIIADDYICGTRYVIGAESAAALAQGAAALLARPPAGAASGTGALGAAVERPRLAFTPTGGLLEASRPAPAAWLSTPRANATPPYAAVNVVVQSGDRLLSYADSRGGGVASRF